MRDFVIVVGHYALLLALLGAGWGTIGAILGVVARGRGLQRSAERALYSACGLTGLAALCLWVSFLSDDFRVDYVYQYSSSSQPLQYKLGALWGGQAGSLLLWALMLTAMVSIMLWTNRAKNRVLMPHATWVAGATTTFFLILVNFLDGARPFVTGPLRPDGVGLNPQLKNYWMMIHPPTLYLGYVAFTIPFAFAIAALVTRRTGDIWIRTTRRWTIFAWFALGTGILLGSYWAYIELGWGGYWAWDPVENASLMPWLTATAFLHSVMIQEKKNMLRVWNMLLIILTFTLSIFGTFLTRSGVISSVHSFATSNIGPAFGVFLALLFFGSMFLLVSRLPSLKSEARLESVLSRESTFLFNNMVLVGIAATVLLLTTFPMLSEAVTDRKVTMGPPIFNLVNVPWALVLLGLMGIGPLIAWRRASRENLRRNFVGPVLVGAWVLGLFLVLDLRAYAAALGEAGRAFGRLDVAGALDAFATFYPALTFGLGAFVIATAALEYQRGLRARRHAHPEALPVALGRMVWRNRRRYAGYLAHVGMVLVFFGVALSSAYRKETVQQLDPGQVLQIEDYLVRYDGYRLDAVDDHLAATTDLAVFRGRDGRPLGTLAAAQHFHPNLQVAELRDAFLHARALGATSRDEEYRRAVSGVYALVPRLEQLHQREVKTPSTEVGILSSFSLLRPASLGEDLYVIPLSVDPASGRANFRVFVNPAVNFIWIGGFVFVVASLLTILPDPRERRKLEAAMAAEERAVA